MPKMEKIIISSIARVEMGEQSYMKKVRGYTGREMGCLSYYPSIVSTIQI